jgi:site-specific DNA recombinase
MLVSRTLLGEATKDGKTVYGSDGMPVMRAEPLVTAAEWTLLRDAMARASKGAGIVRTAGASPMLGVVMCGCGLNMYRMDPGAGKGRPRYRCASHTSKAGARPWCGAQSVRADELTQVVEDMLLAEVGQEPMMFRTFVKGADHTAELERVELALTELRDDREAGLFSGERGTQEYRARVRNLEARRHALQALPVSADRWELTPSGETFAQYWDTLETWDERRTFMKASGLQFVLASSEGAVRERLTFHRTGDLTRPASSTATAMTAA